MDGRPQRTRRAAELRTRGDPDPEATPRAKGGNISAGRIGRAPPALARVRCHEEAEEFGGVSDVPPSRLPSVHRAPATGRRHALYVWTAVWVARRQRRIRDSGTGVFSVFRPCATGRSASAALRSKLGRSVAAHCQGQGNERVAGLSSARATEQMILRLRSVRPRWDSTVLAFFHVGEEMWWSRLASLLPDLCIPGTVSTGCNGT
ncbi:hypothetical protein BRADI_3g05665v3 [Brachypodium distachyon]|uniref:Uncharacterized protein n=1 Tax=Brachypodium distachyon TaxID=15368 RepID=A0A2K2CVF3_BRADI|nr:hypothetical protein BRADI_3g05665v3 [Brachypodium distachyon]